MNKSEMKQKYFGKKIIFSFHDLFIRIAAFNFKFSISIRWITK